MMNKEQAQAIVDLINSTPELQGRAYLCASAANNYAWFVDYRFNRENGTPDYDLISSLHAFHRWLDYQGRVALVDEDS